MILIHGHDLSFSPKILAAFMTDGLLGTFIARLLLYAGIKKVGAARSVPISQGSLLISTFFGVIVLGEIMTEGHLLGVFLLAVGVIIVSYEIESGGSSSNWKPSLELLLPLGGMIFLGLASPFGKIGYSAGAPILLGLTIKSLTGWGLLSGYFLWDNASPLRPFRVEEKHLYLLIGLTQTAEFGFLYSGLSVARVVVVIPFRSLTPLFVLILSYLFLRRLEKINWLIILGAVLTVSGAVTIGLFM